MKSRARREEKEKVEKKKKEFVFQSLADVYRASRGNEFVSTGSTSFDCALGGGVVQKKIINIIGDESSCKTGLLLAVIRMFQGKYKNGIAVIDEPEASLDSGWALQELGLDGKRTELMQPDTDPPSSEYIEQWLENVRGVCTRAVKAGVPFLYGLDSLDALPSKKEFESEIDELDSMNIQLSRGKSISTALRNLKQQIFKSDVTLVIISQTRTKIGVMFGDKTDIAGGKALKFYSDQRMKVAEVGKIPDSRKNVIGIDIKMKVIKNKAARPFMVADSPFYFDFGFDNIESCVDYVRENSSLLGSKGIYTFEGEKFRGKTELYDYISEKKSRTDILVGMFRELWKEIHG